MNTAGKTLGYYFNIADQTRIEPGRLSWRDLVVDVLVLPGAPPRVLDEDELPANLPAELRATIDAGVAAVVGGGDNLIDEIAAASRRLAPRVFPDAA
jgi:predicted RNA-binding protein associated with RNAse of E/G family